MIAKDPQAQAFLVELCALLDKYQASIHADVGSGSDTHGIYERFIRIDLADPDHPWNGDTVFEMDDWEVSAKDILAALTMNS